MAGGMSPEEFQNYLGLLSRLLRLKVDERESIADELRSHLEERLAVLTAQGIEQTRAISMALAEFGDAAALAAEFTAVSRIYKRRWIMRISVGSIAASIIMAAVLISYWPSGTAQSPLNAAHAQQEENVQVNPALLTTTDVEKLDANDETEAVLAKNIDVDFVDMPLEQVKNYLSDATKVQFHLDRKALAEGSVTTDTPITFSMKKIPAEKILQLMLRELNVGYWLDDGIVIITTQEEVDAHLETRFYKVNDLLDLVNYSASISKMVTKPSTPTGPNDSFENQNKVRTLQEVKDDYAVNVNNLIDVITTTLKPTTWDAVGGPGSISEYRGVLIISHTQDVHKEIPTLLNKLRKLIDKSLPIVHPSNRRANTSGGMGGMGGGMF
jgi:hypothetical protein